MFTFPIWILYKFFPDYYVNVKNTLLVQPKNLDDLILIIKFSLSTLIYIGYTFLFLLIVLSIGYLIQKIISSISLLFGEYISSDNDFRDNLFQSIIKICTFLSIYIVSISMYSDLFINYNVPLKIIYTTKAYWISIFPFLIIIAAFILRIILPQKTC